jgi:hypothetical protein
VLLGRFIMRLRLVSRFRVAGFFFSHDGRGLLTKDDRYDGQSERDFGGRRFGGEGLWC